MSDLKLLADLIAAMDIWVMADERLEAIDLQKKYGLTSHDTYWHDSLLSPIDDLEPALISSSINVRIQGTYGFTWALTISLHVEAAEITGEVVLQHSIPEVLRQVAFERVETLKDAVAAAQRTGEALVNDFICTIQQENMFSLWNRLCPSEVRDLDTQSEIDSK